MSASTKKTALAVFSSDRSFFHRLRDRRYPGAGGPLAFGQAYAFHYVVPISIGIAVLLAIVATSYRQTIHAYPSGGGATSWRKRISGVTPGLIAGASLLVDYVLTVSVSIAGGRGGDNVNGPGHALRVAQR